VSDDGEDRSVQLVAIGFPPDAEFEGRIMEELERLAQLRDQGIITDEDFEAKKVQILGI
jgi:Short C-terminal domain